MTVGLTVDAMYKGKQKQTARVTAGGTASEDKQQEGSCEGAIMPPLLPKHSLGPWDNDVCMAAAGRHKLLKHWLHKPARE